MPPADLIQSMGRQMKAEREKRAEILQAEGQRQSAILKAEGQSRRQFSRPRADARRRSAMRKDVTAQPKLEAKATRDGDQAVASGDVAALDYFVAEKYMKVFAELRFRRTRRPLIFPLKSSAAWFVRRNFRDCQVYIRPRCRPQCSDSAFSTAADQPDDALIDVNMMTFIISLGPSKWVILGAVLLGLELAVPGASMMWLGLAAILVGSMSFAVDWSWQAQLVAFAIFTACLCRYGGTLRGRSIRSSSLLSQSSHRGADWPRVHAGKSVLDGVGRMYR